MFAPEYDQEMLEAWAEDHELAECDEKARAAMATEILDLREQVKEISKEADKHERRVERILEAISSIE